jgi:hypothetical protein
MKHRWIYINGEAIPAGRFEPEPVADYHVMPDIQPYQSMCDGSMITSRSQHREHLRAHGVIELGNEAPRAKPADIRKTGVKQELLKSVQQAKEKYGSRHVERAITDSLNAAYEIQRHRR